MLRDHAPLQAADDTSGKTPLELCRAQVSSQEQSPSFSGCWGLPATGAMCGLEVSSRQNCTKPSCSQRLTLCPALMDTPRLQDWMCDTGSPHTAEDIRPCNPRQGCIPKSHSGKGRVVQLPPRDVQGSPALSWLPRKCH